MASPLAALSIACFVPSGPNYAASRQLFAELGFVERWENDGYTGFTSGSATFILQNFDHRVMAENLMLRLEVPDLDAWWHAAAALQLAERFPGFQIKPPTDYPWGREIHFIDLAGVCWHVAAP